MPGSDGWVARKPLLEAFSPRNPLALTSVFRHSYVNLHNGLRPARVGPRVGHGRASGPTGLADAQQ